MSLITQTIEGREYYIRSPLPIVTCNGIDYTVGMSMPLTNYTVGGNVDVATATEHFEQQESVLINEAIIMSYSLPVVEDGNEVWTLLDACPQLTAV